MSSQITRLLILAACSLCVTAQAHAESHCYIVDIPITEPPQGDFIIQLLQLSLDASKAKDEVIELRFADFPLSQERMIAEVRRGESNSMLWTITNKVREENLRPIRIPLFKGLLGYRSLVIRKQDQQRFATIKTRTDLAQYTAGQGEDWPDTTTLRSNQLPVIEGTTHDNLYKMLVAHRFDYFPRGITEIEEEAELIKHHDVMVEPHLILYYPTAMYFFVHPDNDDLAQRLEQGLTRLIERGDYDKLFYALPRVQTALAEFNADKYIILNLINPDISANTTIYPPSYWRNEAHRHLSHSSATTTKSRH